MAFLQWVSILMNSKWVGKQKFKEAALENSVVSKDWL